MLSVSKIFVVVVVAVAVAVAVVVVVVVVVIFPISLVETLPFLIGVGLIAFGQLYFQSHPWVETFLSPSSN